MTRAARCARCRRAPRGACAVRFKSAIAAQQCVLMMNERQFGNARLTAELYDGVSDYRASAAKAAAASAHKTLEEQEASLEAFARDLEAESTDSELEPDGD